MAQQVNLDKLCCSICLDLLKEPVTVPCGHNYCMSCIKRYWNQEDQKGTHSCPQCRRNFVLRPVLLKNTLLADLVDELHKARLPTAPADHCYAGPEDVACDVCTGRKLKATKSCLQCLISYCDQHLQPHYQSLAFEKHKLVDSIQKLQENLCPRHNEVMKIFCRTDQQCICYLCLMDEHKGHDTVSAAAERSDRQREVGASQQNIQQKIKKAEKHIEELQLEVEAINQSADNAVSCTEKIFTDLIRLIEKRGSDVRQQIRSQQTNQVKRVRELEDKLEQEITELRREGAELEQLSRTEDHVQFLHNYSSVSYLSQSAHPPNVNVHPQHNFDDVTTAVTEVSNKIQDILREGWEKISLRVDCLVPQTEPEARTEFLQHSCQIQLDPNTAHIWLLLSKRNRRATVMRQMQEYPDHPDRFTDMQQVLGTKSLTGRVYWEVEMDMLIVRAAVAVAYKDIRKTGRESGFGDNDRSWALKCFKNELGIMSYKFIHDKIRTSISGPWSSRVGVFVDHRAGILSFYSVSETMTLLHRVQTTFTQPLYAGLRVYGYGHYIELCE